MPLLYYWRGENYYRDLDFGVGYHLNQRNPLMHAIDIGDSLWAFTRTRTGRYALAAELVVRAKTFNPPSFRYGHYRVWGDLEKSRYFKRVESLVQLSKPGIVERRAEYLYTSAPVRNRQLNEELRALYGGKCQVCKWDPKEVYSQELCHAHHLQWFNDELENMALVCPNHHAAIHQCDAPFDFSDKAFVFEQHREPLQLNSHL